jgi:hypothetical protein
VARRIRFDETLARRLCRRLAEGETLLAICREAGMPARGTVYDWLAARPEFHALYRQARQQQLETWGEEIVQLADGLDGESDRETLARVKLRIEVRQWLIARLAGRGGEQDETPRGKERRPLVIQVVTGITRPGDPEVLLAPPGGAEEHRSELSQQRKES